MFTTQLFLFYHPTLKFTRHSHRWRCAVRRAFTLLRFSDAENVRPKRNPPVCIYDNVMVESFVRRRVREFNTGRETVCDRKCSDRPLSLQRTSRNASSSKAIDASIQVTNFFFFPSFFLFFCKIERALGWVTPREKRRLEGHSETMVVMQLAAKTYVRRKCSNRGGACRDRCPSICMIFTVLFVPVLCCNFLFILNKLVFQMRCPFSTVCTTLVHGIVKFEMLHEHFTRNFPFS